MKTKKEIKAWLENQEKLPIFDRDQMSRIVDDIQDALKINPKRTKFELNVDYVSLPLYNGLKPE